MLSNSNVSNCYHEEKDKQTFNELDGFKILVLSKTESKSIALCKWLSGTNKEISGGYRKSSCENFFPFWYKRVAKLTDCHVYDAILIDAEIEEEFLTLNDEVKNKYKTTPLKLIISKNEKIEHWGNDSDMKIFHMQFETKPREITEKLLQMDRELYQSLEAMFQKYDDDKSGYIELNEIGNIAKAMGDDPRSEKFKRAILALDTDHDNRISFDEFIKYFKFGRGQNNSLAEVYDLHNNINEFMYSTWDFINLRKEIRSHQDDISKTMANLSVAMSSTDSFLAKTRINLKFSIGAQQRLENAKNYLSKFSDDLTHAKSDWFAIGVFLKPNGIPAKEAATYLNEFKDNVIRYLDRNRMLGLSEFVTNFLLFEVVTYDYSVNLMIRLKPDIKSLVAFALENLLLVRDFLGQFDFELKLTSHQSLGQLVTCDTTSFRDFLKSYEILIKSTSYRNKVKILLENLFDQSYMTLLQFLFVPTNFKLEFTGQVEELTDKTSKEFLEIKMNSFEPGFSFLKDNIHERLYQSLSRIEFTCNFFDVFANLQIYSGSLNI